MNNVISLVRDYLEIGACSSGVSELTPNLLELGTRNKLVPLLAEVVHRRYSREIPSRLGSALRVLAAHEALRMGDQRGECVRLAEAFRASGIPFAVRKGPGLARLYKQLGDRPYEDIDFLVCVSDRDSVHGLLTQLGYLAGSFNRFSGEMLPATREMRIQYRLRPDHLPHYYRPAPQSPLGAYIVDVAFTSGWHGDGFELNTHQWLANTVCVDSLDVLDDVRNFIDVALHLYRETFLVGSVRRSAPCLRSFADVYLCYRAIKDPADVWRLCSNPKLEVAVRQTVELVETVLQTSLQEAPRRLAPEHLLHCVVRDDVDQPIAVSLLDRMAALSHQEYEALVRDHVVH